MSASMKKLLGSLWLLFGLIAYIIVVFLVARFLPHITLIELPFYLVAGLGWIFPARWIIAWMHR